MDCSCDDNALYEEATSSNAPSNQSQSIPEIVDTMPPFHTFNLKTFSSTHHRHDDKKEYGRRNQFGVVLAFSCALFLCVNILTPQARPYEQRMEIRSIPFSSRRIHLNFSIFNLRETMNRFLEEENPDENENDDENVEAEDDVKGYDDYHNLQDDAYYDKYYEEEVEEDDDYEEVIDDFYPYIDDETIESRTILPLEVSDVTGLLCTAFCIILSIGGGIGPGATLVAVYIIVMDFPPKVAIPLASITCLGISTVSIITNVPRRHPLTDRPIIDWDLILIMEPLTLFGAIVGTHLNKILEEKVIMTLLVLLLSIIAHNTLKKAKKMHHAEQLYAKRILWAKSKKNTEQISLFPSNSFEGGLAKADPPFVPKVHSINSQQGFITKRENGNSKSLTGGNTSVNGDSTRSEAGRTRTSQNSSFSSFIVLRKGDVESVKSSLMEEEAHQLPQNKITYIVAMFLFVIAMNVFKGGGAFESPLGISCGSLYFWLVEILTMLWLFAWTYLASRYLLRRHAIKEAVGYDYVRGDIIWDVRTIVIYPSVCVIAGIVSGMFGIGCAIVIGPMLVGIGVNPSVVAATCGCMNFFTSLAATSQYMVLGSVIPDSQYAIVCLILGIIMSYIGNQIMLRVTSTKIKKNKRLELHSYMAYSMGLVVLVSALSMTVEALLSVVSHKFDEDEKDGICEIETMY